MEQIGDVVVATRGGVPVRVKDIAEVKIGRELRVGSASENGDETVIGTAMMLIGGNSRSVSAMVDAKMKEINRTLPPGVEIKTALNRTLLVDATVKTVSKNLIEGAFLVILVLFGLLACRPSLDDVSIRRGVSIRPGSFPQAPLPRWQ